jgi:hypothetical protein
MGSRTGLRVIERIVAMNAAKEFMAVKSHQSGQK